MGYGLKYIIQLAMKHKLRAEPKFGVSGAHIGYIIYRGSEVWTFHSSDDVVRFIKGDGDGVRKQ